jgi:Asp-tRNA(Asn)/Glu-tRNA(Gln) amidotransferase C subunit
VALTHEEVRRLARLARLRLAPAEVESLAVELEAVLQHVRALPPLPAAEGSDPTDGGLAG